MSKISTGSYIHFAIIMQDEASIAALKEYARALAHPISGIPCQVLAG